MVAEGIEDQEQTANAEHLGCEVGQGYLFSKPSAADTIEALLGQRQAALAAEVTGSASHGADSGLSNGRLEIMANEVTSCSNQAGKNRRRHNVHSEDLSRIVLQGILLV